MKDKILACCLCVFMLLVGCARNGAGDGAVWTTNKENVKEEQNALEESELIIAENTVGYDTPEGAIRSFVAMIPANDLIAMVNEFSCQEQIDNFNDEEGNRLNITTSLESLQQDAEQEIISLYFWIQFTSDELYNGMDEGGIFEQRTRSMQAATTGEEYITNLGYQNASVLRTDILYDYWDEHEEMVVGNDTVKAYGAEAWDYRFALIKVDGRTYIMGVQFLKYGGKYKIYDLNMGLISFDSNIRALPCNEAEYLGYLGITA